MKIVVIICRILLGLGFVVFGLNGFLHFMGAEPKLPLDQPVGQFVNAMNTSGWMHAVSAMQVLGGVLVLIGGTAPIGLVVLGPILFNVLCFHIFLTAGHEIAPGLVFTLLEVILIYAYRPYFKGIFATRATPSV